MNGFGLSHLADKIADLALEAARAKKGPRETKRRIAAAVLPIVMEARRSGLQAAIIALGPGYVDAVNVVNRQIEAER